MRIACGVEYDGSAYYGWQRQLFDGLPTLQETLENALTQVANHPVVITAAGRTDAGVHATEQVIHFDTEAKRTERAWVLGANTYLPGNIALKWAREVSPDFHARYSAIARRYQYLILNSAVRSPLLHQRATLIYQPLDAEKMHHAAQVLIGEHDFSAFRAAGCQSHSPMRNVEYINIGRQGSFIIAQIQANAFLHHMVRNIMGALIAIGAGEQPIEWMQTILAGRDRTLVPATAPACGLYLVKVIYPFLLNS